MGFFKLGAADLNASRDEYAKYRAKMGARNDENAALDWRRGPGRDVSAEPVVTNPAGLATPPTGPGVARPDPALQLPYAAMPPVRPAPPPPPQPQQPTGNNVGKTPAAGITAVDTTRMTGFEAAVTNPQGRADWDFNNEMNRVVAASRRMPGAPIGFFRDNSPELRSATAARVAAANWFGTKEARQYFQASPNMLRAAEFDPLEFYNKNIAGRAAGARPQPPDGRSGVPASDLAAAVMQVESGGDPNAVSSEGARGRMQVMPHTAHAPGIPGLPAGTVRPAKDDSIEEYDRVGRDYLAALVGKYKGNVLQALMAYNWGPGATDRWLARGRIGKVPKQTRDYVDSVLAQLGDGVVAPGGAPAATAAVASAAPQAGPAATAAVASAAPQAGVAMASERVTTNNAGRYRSMEAKAGVTSETDAPSARARTTPLYDIPEPQGATPAFQAEELRNLRALHKNAQADLYIAASSGQNRKAVEAEKVLRASHALMQNQAVQYALNLASYNNDPRLLSAYLSDEYKRNFEVGPNADGTWYTKLDGKLVSVDKKEVLISRFRKGASIKYAEAQRAAKAASASADRKAELKFLFDVGLEKVKGAHSTLVERIKKAGFVKGTDGDLWLDTDGVGYTIVEAKGEDGEGTYLKLKKLAGTGTSPLAAYER